MDALEYLEDQARRNASFSLDNLDRMGQRAIALLTLLLSGAGAAGAYALGQIGKPGGMWVVAALGALSSWWFALAAWAALRTMPPKNVRAPANDGLQLLQTMRGPLQAYVDAAKQRGEEVADAYTLLRENELQTLHDTAAIYRNASASIAKELDGLYLYTASSPVAVLVALVLVYWLRPA